MILVAGPGVAASSPDIQRIDITSAQEMYTIVHEHLAAADIFIGVAAVSDYRPANPEEQKIKRHLKADEDVKLSLIENPDIIASVVRAKQAKVVVGFAAEPPDTLQNARDKRTTSLIEALVLTAATMR